MNRNIVYLILTLLKAIIIITGMVFVILNIVSWRKTGDGKRLKQAIIIFGGIFLSILILSAIEFFIALN